MNLMTVIVILVGCVQALMGVVLALLISRHNKAEASIEKLKDEFSTFRAEVPARYANEADIKRVEEAIAAVRHDLSVFTTETRTTLVSIAATVNQIVGASSHRG